MIFVFQRSKPWRKGLAEIDPKGERIEIRSRSFAEAQTKLPFINPLKATKNPRVWIHVNKYTLSLEAQIEELKERLDQLTQE